MYLETNNKEKSSHLRMSEDKEVNEATAALKGMLGIGGSGGAPDGGSNNSSNENKKKPNNKRGKKGKSKSPTRDTTISKDTPQPSAGANTGDKPQKSNINQNKNKKKNKKNKNTIASTVDGEGEGDIGTNPNTNPNANVKSGGNNNPNKNKKKKNKGGKNNNNSNNNQKSNSKTPQKDTNFAWSAYQSSPDARQLPMPAFQPSPNVTPSQNKPVVQPPSGKDADALARAAALVMKTNPESIMNANTNNDGSSKASDDKSTSSTSSSKSKKSSKSSSNKQVPAKKVETQGHEKVKEELPFVKKTSKTGVNIAALSSSKAGSMAPSPSGVDSDATTRTSADAKGISSSDGPKSNKIPASTTAPATNVTLPQQSQPRRHQVPIPLPPPHPMNVPHHPPPGYVTLHVQVPYQQLGPGREMLVQSPGGFPVQVIVPPNIPPGTIIPVQVPSLPLHMMPQQPPSAVSGQQRNPGVPLPLHQQHLGGGVHHQAYGQPHHGAFLQQQYHSQHYLPQHSFPPQQHYSPHHSHPYQNRQHQPHRQPHKHHSKTHPSHRPKQQNQQNDSSKQTKSSAPKK
mmetsp:Transcript_5731/g.14311  ORF Transcript_5731/g.14311 Transcript_5731/m.14311 type:complete len:569 (-) Transcript_5731:213-1919(-)